MSEKVRAICFNEVLAECYCFCGVITQGCSLGLKRLGLQTVSSRFFERLVLVSIPSLQSLGFVTVSASYVSFT